MIAPAEFEHVMFPCVEFNFNTTSLNLYEIAKEKYRKCIDDPKSAFRRKIVNNNTFTYLTDTTDNIISYTFDYKHDFIKNFNKKEVVNNAMKNSNKTYWLFGKDGYIVCFSHTLLDGITSYNITTILADKQEPIILPRFYYIPIYNELLTIYGLVLLSFQGLPKLNLSYDYHSRKTDYCKIVKAKIPISFVKKYKKNVSSELGEQVSFPIVFCAMQSLSIFYSSKKEFLNVGVVVAFNNKNRFNNFTAIQIKLKRPSDIDNLETNFEDICKEMIKNVQKKAKENYFKLQLFYSITNIYNSTISLNKTIDILISGIPMCKKQQHTFKGIVVGDVWGSLPYHSMPVYQFYLSDMNYSYLTTHIRTNDIDCEKLRYIYDKYLESQKIN
jgi:hypothetical protein